MHFPTGQCKPTCCIYDKGMAAVEEGMFTGLA